MKAEKILLIVLLVATAGAIAFAEVGVPVYIGPHTITFTGKTYDSNLDRSTWSYTVTSIGSPAISHWVLGLCLPDHVVTAASPNNWSIVDPGKFTLVSGIKWDQGFDTETTIDFWVTLAGDWEVAEVNAGIKAGSLVFTGMIDGPSCTPSTLDLTVSGLTDLTITQPDLKQWFGGGTCQSLGTLTVTVEASVNYKITACYTVTTSTPPFDDDPLRFEHPPGGGTWTVLPEWSGPESGVNLLDFGFSGSPNTPGGETVYYPVQIDLKELGDREGGETFTFTIHVVLSEL